MIPNPFSAQPPVLIDLTEDSSSELRFKPRTKDSLNAEIQLVGDTIQVCLKIKHHILESFQGHGVYKQYSPGDPRHEPDSALNYFLNSDLGLFKIKSLKMS
jgi:hypothetical protein